MSSNSPISKEKFWQFLKELESIEEGSYCNKGKEIDYKHFSEKLGLSEEEFIGYLAFLRNFDYKVSLKKKEGKNIVVFEGDKPEICFKFNFSEWLAFQAHFPKLSEYNNEPFHQPLANKLQEIESQYPQYDLHQALKDEGSKENYVKSGTILDKTVIDKIDECLAQDIVVQLKLNGKEGFNFFPHRLVYLDGGLTLVGEDCADRCLVYFYVKNITAINSNAQESYDSNFSLYEVDEFINAIRSVAGKEIRLVLKVTSESMINLNPKYQTLGNTYVTSNPEGDLIWAASVEKSNLLFEWLYEIKENAEILDPTWLKEEFEQYCAQIEPLKKVS